MFKVSLPVCNSNTLTSISEVESFTAQHQVFPERPLAWSVSRCKWPGENDMSIRNVPTDRDILHIKPKLMLETQDPVLRTGETNTKTVFLFAKRKKKRKEITAFVIHNMVGRSGSKQLRRTVNCSRIKINLIYSDLQWQWVACTRHSSCI